MADAKSMDTLITNTIRCLAADTVQGANSGHPGMPMGMAPIANVLWRKHLRGTGANPKWLGRDRFVLSNGHGCALLYSMLHLNGYKLSMDDLKNFRQLNSITPGHPEAGHDTPGVEVTTGPLGQGIANAVGMAIAERHLATTFNKPGFPVFDNFVYVFCGDGCLQEGISSEAASLAGHLKLGKIILMYDDNQISIDGSTNISFSEDVLKRFEAYGWHTSTVHGGDDNFDGINNAIAAAKAVADQPSIIAVKTTIGFGAKNQGKESVHGSPLGDADIADVKKKFGFDPAVKYFVPDEVRAEFGKTIEQNASLEAQWNKMYADYEAKHPAEAAEIKRRFAGELPAGWQDLLPTYKPSDKADATRNLSGKALNALADKLAELMGGSADLTPSNKTALNSSGDFQAATPAGRYIRFGVREHAMGAIGNGLSAYGGIVPFTATFLNFIEYMFPAVRLAAISHHQQLFIMTHDSIGVGEDGPTHQPIEALTICRATPNLLTLRPADGNETSGAYKVAMSSKTTPSVLSLTRQNLPQLKGSSVDAVAKGGYVLQDAEAKKPDVVLVASGSEVPLCVDAAALLAGKNVRVVSMPCWELFDAQPVAYRREVIPPGVPVVAVETASPTGWEKYSHYQIAMTTFGASAPIEAVMDHFGFTKEKVAAKVTAVLSAFEAQSKELGVSAAGLLPIHLSL